MTDDRGQEEENDTGQLEVRLAVVTVACFIDPFLKRLDWVPTSPRTQAPGPVGRTVSTRIDSLNSGPEITWPSLMSPF